MNKRPFCTTELYPEGSPVWRLIQARLRRSTADRAADTRPRPANIRPAENFHEDLFNRATQALVAHVLRQLQQAPLKVLRDPQGRRRVRVMGALDYLIDATACKVWVEPSPFTKKEQRSQAAAPWGCMSRRPLDKVDLLNPLCKPAWLEYVATRSGWFASPFAKHQPQQAQLFMQPSERLHLLRYVAHAAFLRLRHTPALAELQSDIAAALAAQLGADLLELGLRSRPFTRNNCLRADHFNRVWQHRSAFETMARENPRLLSALAAWLEDGGAPLVDSPKDTLPAMRKDLLASGLPPKAWRVLTQKGLHKLLPSQARHPLWKTMTQTLWSLHHAQWPPVPPRAFIQLLNDVAGRPQTFHDARGALGGWFWRVACTEADRLRQQAGAFEALVRQMPQHTHMLHETGWRPDTNQLRVGMAWLQAQTRRYLLFAQACPQALWLPWLPDPTEPEPQRRLTWVVLRSPRDLLEESMALHNCATDYQDRCSSGTWAMVSLRQARTGKRLALAGLELHAGQWRLAQVAGPCNRLVSTTLHQQARLALEWVRYHHQRLQPSPPPTPLDPVDSAWDFPALAQPPEPINPPAPLCLHP
jgi:hypothetical protein